eukprot:7579974-Pyramimonas_sp.AAC.1
MKAAEVYDDLQGVQYGLQRDMGSAKENPEKVASGGDGDDAAGGDEAKGSSGKWNTSEPELVDDSGNEAAKREGEEGGAPVVVAEHIFNHKEVEPGTIATAINQSIEHKRQEDQDVPAD